MEDLPLAIESILEVIIHAVNAIPFVTSSCYQFFVSADANLHMISILPKPILLLLSEQNRKQMCC
jgi:hypothetical protein